MPISPKVYFVECGDYIKIGYTTQRVRARLKAIQSANPHEVKLLFAGMGTFEQEQNLHYHLRAFHVRGEWFRKSPEFMEALEKACGLLIASTKQAHG